MVRLVGSILTVLGVFAMTALAIHSTLQTPVAQAESAEAIVPIVVEDSRGRSHELDAPAERFAACSSFALETLMAMGIEPVVRFEVPPVYPAEAEPIPVVARSHSTGPDVEMLLASRPDVILLHDVFHSFADAVQQTVGVPVILHQLKSVDDVRSNITMLGKIAGKPDAAAALLEDIDAAITWANDQPKPANAPMVVSLFGTNDAWFAHRNNSFMGDLMNTLGVTNVAADAEAHSRYRSLAPIDVERLVAEDPDVILLMLYNEADDSVLQEFQAHPAFKALRAVRTGRVHVLDAPIYTSHAGPRTGEALRTLYSLFYADTSPSADASQAQP